MARRGGASGKWQVEGRSLLPQRREPGLGLSSGVAHCPRPPGTVLVLALRVPCPGTPSVLGKLGGRLFCSLVCKDSPLDLRGSGLSPLSWGHPSPSLAPALLSGGVGRREGLPDAWRRSLREGRLVGAGTSGWAGGGASSVAGRGAWAGAQGSLGRGGAEGAWLTELQACIPCLAARRFRQGPQKWCRPGLAVLRTERVSSREEFLPSLLLCSSPRPLTFFWLADRIRGKETGNPDAESIQRDQRGAGGGGGRLLKNHHNLRNLLLLSPPLVRIAVSWMIQVELPPRKGRDP